MSNSVTESEKLSTKYLRSEYSGVAVAENGSSTQVEDNFGENNASPKNLVKTAKKVRFDLT